MEDPASRPPIFGPAHRAKSQRRRESPERLTSRLRLSAAVAVPTAVLVLVAAVVAGGAGAASRFGAANNQGQKQGLNRAQLANARAQMPAPRLKGKAAKRAAAKAAAPAAAAAAAAAAAVNANCTLIVPPNPTTARGLATPYQLVATDPAAGPCNEGNVNQSAFVQGAIISPAGQLTLYDPLVIDKGTKPIVAPTPAQVPAGSAVAVWFGFNGDQLTLANAAGRNSLAQGKCVNGLPGSIFGQFAHCNAVSFFKRANAAIRANKLQIPALGTANDGMTCPSTRDYFVVDQDQSDNVNSHYLLAANGQTGQSNAATRAALQQKGQNTPVDLANGSDNRLLNTFYQPILGCATFTRPNGAMDGAPSPSLPLNELQAALFQPLPIANVPLNDPMTLVNGNPSAAKTTLYRAGVNDTPVGMPDDGNGTTYCNTLFNNPVAVQRVFRDQATLANGPSPAADAASNLFTFLAMRAQGTFENLGCGALLKQANPITLTLTNGIVTAAVFTPAAAAAPAAPAVPAAPAAAPPAAPAAPAAP